MINEKLGLSKKTCLRLLRQKHELITKFKNKDGDTEWDSQLEELQISINELMVAIEQEKHVYMEGTIDKDEILKSFNLDTNPNLVLFVTKLMNLEVLYYCRQLNTILH